MFDNNRRGGGRGYRKPMYKGNGSPTSFTMGGVDGGSPGVNPFSRDNASVADEGDGYRYGPDFGLPPGVMVPSSIYDGLLQGDVLLALQRMPPDQINVALTQYDYQIKKRGTFIRNKRGYLMGIINSGPKFGLPQGVIIPPCLTPAMVQGEILDLLRMMPVYQINITLGDYDEQMRKKGSTIRNKQAYFLGVVKKKKKEFEQVPLYDQRNLHDQEFNQQSYILNQQGNMYQPSQQGNMYQPSQQGNMYHPNHDTHRSLPGVDSLPMRKDPNAEDEEVNEEELDETLHLLSDSLERVRLLTESLGKVTNELVSERENRDALEALIKSEQEFRKATEENLIKAVEDLAQEKDLREVEKLKFEALLVDERGKKEEAEKELETLRAQVQQENNLRKEAEEKLLMLEEILISERNVRDEERHIAIPDFSERSNWT